VNDSRVRQRLSEGTLYGVKVGDEWRLPAFQFLEKEPVPGIERVLPRLPERLSLVAVHRWFHTPNPDLQLPEPARPLSPMEWLRAGQDPEPVAELAAGL